MFTAPELRLGRPQSHGRLTAYPLFVDRPSPARYRLAEEALADGTAVVEEVTESGNVPYLAVENTGDTEVLFLEGQELRGAKQNRVLNTSVLIPAKVKATLPVSCVEQGRWRYTSQHFAASGMHSSTKMRTVLKRTVSDSTRVGRGHGSDQSEVWSEVSRQMSSHGAASPTMSMADTYESRRQLLDEHVNGLAYPEGAAGLVVAIGDRVVAVDVFDNPETCRKVWSRLLTGAAMDAIESPDAAAPADEAVRDAVEGFRAGTWQPVPAVAAGEEYRGGRGDRWHGSVLAQGGTVIHGSLVLAG
jgi:hypothetical protein